MKNENKTSKQNNIIHEYTIFKFEQREKKTQAMKNMKY